ncbi:MAG: NAD(P)/FAD-dependent oxidoreductase [Gemmatimonadales bacterium]|jgi:sulfide:quinone oxidoreductase|nr:MAG: NAD(P)/FAD-dependent oxidoreductase [Gemmatimonadales bacterium]
MKKLLILGAGTAGTMMSAKLRRKLDPEEWSITVVDQDNEHIYQPGLLFIPFGTYRRRDVIKPRSRYIPAGVQLIQTEIERIAPDENQVRLTDGTALDYDFLIIATGSQIVPTETEGMTGPGWFKNTFDFYTLDGAMALYDALDRFKGGRLVLNTVEMPIKCPVAPLEFAFLADWYFTERGMRDKVEIVYATPLDGAFTKPKASAMLGGLMDEKDIQVVPNWNTGEVDGEKRVLSTWDGQEMNYDLLVTVPTNMGSDVVERSEIGDEGNWVATDKHTLQSKVAENIFVIGDATDLPSSKAGSVAHFEGEVLEENLLRAIEGRDLLPEFDGHANCFVETGFGKAVLIDFNYDTEPLPGRFPLPALGPLTLLEESEMNHWGKLAFKWVYWNLLLKGEEIPLAEARMSMAGKWR